MDKVYEAMKRAQKISKNKKPKSKKKAQKKPDGFTQFVIDKARSEDGTGGVNPLDPRTW